jgi:glycosyltransferase involved in cell wall biosynthesis
VGLADRKIILVPKGYENVTNKTTPVLEALHSLGDELVGYEVHVMMSSPETETFLRQMPRWLQEKVHCHEMVPKERLLDLMRRARIMIAPSLSDGTPNTMLEAMAAGALPIMSPVESILEWIEDGENGLIAHALYPDRIAKAVKRGLRDDDLFYRALRRNRELVRTRANRAIIRTQVLEYYRSLVTSETGKVR